MGTQLITVLAIAILGIFSVPVVENINIPSPTPTVTESPTPTPTPSPTAISTTLPENGTLNVKDENSSIKVTNSSSNDGNCSSSLNVQTEGDASVSINSDCKSSSVNSYSHTSTIDYNLGN